MKDTTNMMHRVMGVAVVALRVRMQWTQGRLASNNNQDQRGEGRRPADVHANHLAVRAASGIAFAIASDSAGEARGEARTSRPRGGVPGDAGGGAGAGDESLEATEGVKSMDSLEAAMGYWRVGPRASAAAAKIADRRRLQAVVRRPVRHNS